ncbi:hypothetical protein E4V51_33950 [Paenibacillus sp. 28ISP30-2]|nr:hypothetical protein [Paenibacillus sp. 28ISP30-2]
MKNEKITRKNPAGMPKPVGNYTHITKIPRNSELFVTSGQVGVDQNGQFPESFNLQISNTFNNIKSVLDAEQLTADNIIKVIV